MAQAPGAETASQEQQLAQAQMQANALYTELVADRGLSEVMRISSPILTPLNAALNLSSNEESYEAFTGAKLTKQSDVVLYETWTEDDRLFRRRTSRSFDGRWATIDYDEVSAETGDGERRIELYKVGGRIGIAIWERQEADQDSSGYRDAVKFSLQIEDEDTKDSVRAKLEDPNFAKECLDARRFFDNSAWHFLDEQGKGRREFVVNWTEEFVAKLLESAPDSYKRRIEMRKDRPESDQTLTEWIADFEPLVSLYADSLNAAFGFHQRDPQTGEIMKPYRDWPKAWKSPSEGFDFTRAIKYAILHTIARDAVLSSPQAYQNSLRKKLALIINNVRKQVGYPTIPIEESSAHPQDAGEPMPFSEPQKRPFVTRFGHVRTADILVGADITHRLAS